RHLVRSQRGRRRLHPRPPHRPLGLHGIPHRRQKSRRLPHHRRRLPDQPPLPHAQTIPLRRTHLRRPRRPPRILLQPQNPPPLLLPAQRPRPPARPNRNQQPRNPHHH